MGDELVFENDGLYSLTKLYSMGNLVDCRRQLVMSKEVFIKCYEKWILNKEDPDDIQTT